MIKLIFTIADNTHVQLIMWLIGKFAISCAFILLFVYTSEIFPTVVRNGCIGACEVVGRIGGVFAAAVKNMVFLVV